jgi:spermidine/putrescine transport system permease protein
MIAPALVAAFCLCFTLSWDEFLIAYLNTRFDVTLPVVIWDLLRGGLNPETNAAGSFIFLVSISVMAIVELFLRRGRRS